MAYSFGDSFDLYAATADMLTGYWDSGSVSGSLVAGRFAGSRAYQTTNLASNVTEMVKSSGVNDALHHIVLAFRPTAAITGSSLSLAFTLQDGASAQCTVVFRSDGAILLTSGFANGTVLATYTGAFPVTTTWYAFEIEVLISSTAGYMNVRKNGNSVNDFSSATNLNTRTTANNYANRLFVGTGPGGNGNQMQFDDLFWRSDATTVPWMGDIRCFTRMPVSDQSVQFSRSTGATNFSCVDEAQQNAATDYVFDSTPGDADFYGIGTIASTPVSTIAVTTRGYMQKSDAGSRTAAIQLKSGASTVASPTLTLSSSGWLWTYRTDITDPATGAAWTATAVNNCQIGPTTIA